MALQTFTAGQVLTAAQMTNLQANDYNQTVSTKTASYTLVAADKGTRVVMNSASATTITVNTSLFSAGDTLVLQNISTGVCTVTAGTATVSTAGSLAISQNGSGILYFTSAGVSIFYPSAGASAKLGQVVNTVKTDTFSATTTTYTDITGLSVTITPTSASSTILIFVSVNGSGGVGGDMIVQLLRNATVIGNGDTAGSRRVAFAQIGSSTGNINNGFINILDSPATTSATTYKIQGAQTSGAGTFFVNRSTDDVNSASYVRVSSQITAIEVLP